MSSLNRSTKAAVGIGVALIGGSGAIGLCVILVLLALIASPTGPFAEIAAQECSSNIATTAEQAKATAAADSIPQNYLDLYQKAGLEWNIPWNVLAGIGWVETHHGTLQAETDNGTLQAAAGVLSGENFAGAGGPMQFLQGTFNRAKVDGDNDGVMSRYDPADAIFSAAKLLKLHIFPSADTQELKKIALTAAQIREAVHKYNPGSKTYTNDVLAAANRYAKGYTTAPANDEGQGCASALAAVQAGPFGQAIADTAAFYAERVQGGPNPPHSIGKKIPYSWGGGDPKGDNPNDGPSFGIPQNPGVDGTHIYGFDCSGLARWAVYSASGKKILLPRTADEMFRSNKGIKVSRDQLEPGDLVFFENLNHMGIYYGIYKGKRWMVEAPHSGAYVRFAQFDSRSHYVGALRVKPPPGMANQSPSPLRAMSPPGAEAGGGVM